METMTTDLAERQAITALVGSYQKELAAVENAYKALHDAEANLKRDFFNDHFSVRPARDYGHYDTETFKRVAIEMNRQAWKSIVDRLGIRQLLSIARREELDRQLSGESDRYNEEPARLPEITEENIIGMMRENMSKATEYAQEAVFEVFDWLRPSEHSRIGQLKTNQKWSIGKKAIIGYSVECGYGKSPFHIRYGSEKRFNALDSVMQMLDGKGPLKGHVSPLVEAVRASTDGEGATDYFKFSCCKNGNIHLTFLRPDLVQKINKTAGNRTQLPGRR